MNPIFNRQNDTPSGIQRSKQYGLSRRKTFTQHYGRIYPNFKQILNPNESITVRATNYLRTIPMVTPQLSRVRVMQSFIAVPLRILWSHWEEYIKGDEDSGFLYTEPYITNTEDNDVLTGYVAPIKEAGVIVDDYKMPRGITLGADGYPAVGSGALHGYQFFPDELGEALDAPKNLMYNCADGAMETYRRTAYDFAAYQLAYSYFYRNENVQKRIDDFYELTQETGMDREYPPYAFQIKADGTRESVYRKKDFETASGDVIHNIASIIDSGHGSHADKTQSTSTEDIWRTSWEYCEKFPLRNGPNLSLSAMCVNSDGDVQFKPSTISLTRWRYVNWSQDRFTTANPWQQRGEESLIPVDGTISVTASLSDSSDVVVKVGSLDVLSVFNQADTINSGSYVTIAQRNDENKSIRLHNGTSSPAPFDAGATPFKVSVPSAVNTSAVHQLYVTPSDFRFAMALQKIKEMSAATDNRYKSYLKKFFNANLNDGRADRPEYLGGYVQDLNVSEVLQQSEDGNTPLGTAAGVGRSGDTTYTIRYTASEHCIILGLTYILPDTEYISGFDREFNTRDRFDWELPQLSGMSEQPIYLKEITCTQNNPDEVFGYEPFYNHLRWKDSRANGDFSDTLNILGNYEYYKPWIITRDFGDTVGYDDSTGEVTVTPNVPTLSDAFLSTRHTSDYSNFTVDKSLMNPFMQDSYFKVDMVRNIPAVGIPRL